MKVRWLTMGLPLALSVGILALMINGQLNDSVLRLRLSEADLVVVVGVLLSALLAVNFSAQERLKRIHRESMTKAREETAEEHRRFLNRLDHEIKNPLMAIRAGLANLSGTTDELARQQIVGGVDAQVLRLSHLVADLRKVADIGARPLDRDLIHAADLAREAFSMAQDESVTQQRCLSLVQPLDDSLVDGDRDLLALALHNLLNNAIKFSRLNDKVEMRVLKDGDDVIFEVSDSGPGIPEIEINHVWKELYRGQAAQGIPGHGIGLALVQAIVERHDGRVEVRSAVGCGATVSIRLPAYRQNNTRSVSPQ